MSVLPTIVRSYWHSPAIQRVHHRGAHRRERQTPALTGNERILARIESAMGSDRALYLTCGPAAWRRVDWADVASVVRSNAGDVLILRLWSDDGTGTDKVRVPADAAFAAFATERVAATQVLRRRVPIPGGFATVTAVRTPGQDAVLWRVQLDRDDPAVLRTVRQAIADISALAGC